MNGYSDDVNGWNFFEDADPSNDNNPNPSGTNDNHGTAVAGVAAAIGNSIGVSGASRNARVMPVKIYNNGAFAGYDQLAQAIYYAAGRTANGLGTWDAADVINYSSYASGVTSVPVVDAAIAWATSNGRGGKGVPYFSIAGNDAAGTTQYLNYQPITLTGVPAGNWQFEWRYSKDSIDTGATGENRAWLANVRLPDGSTQRFDAAGLPSGWMTSGNASWTVQDDPAHAYGTGRYVAGAGTIGNNQSTNLRSPTVTVPIGGGDISYSVWISSEAGFDGLRLFASLNGGAFTVIDQFPNDPFKSFFSGVPSVANAVGYPANLADAIAVGASTDWDYRAAYSQYGNALDFVAPSRGGYGEVTTTDRTGTEGYNAASGISGDYTSTFGGTSAAAPLAAGIAALMLSENPNLKASDIRALMRKTADKIGGNNGQTAYNAAGFNQYYGYGRVDAAAAVTNLSVTGVTISGPNSLDGVNGSYTIPAGSGQQLKSVPIGGANKITIDFSTPLNTSSTNINGKLTLTNKQTGAAVSVGNPSVVAGSNNTKLTWTLGAALPPGIYRITLADTLQSALGVRLDGEFTNPTNVDQLGTSQLPSGDGSAQGAFNFDFVYLPADSNQDNRVDGADLIVWKTNFGAPGEKFTTGDSNGDGYGAGADFLQWQRQLGHDFRNLPLANAETTTYATVAGVTIGGSSSTHAAYTAPTGSGEQLRTVPLGGADTISLTFTAAVSLSGDELSIRGADSGQSYLLVFEGYDPLTYTATWRAADGPLPHDQLVVTLAEGVVDGTSTPVDGEWINPGGLGSSADYYRDLSLTGAGDGLAGGAFTFRITMLPGDFNRDNKVDEADFQIVDINQSMTGATFADGDYDGDGDVDAADYYAVEALLAEGIDYTVFADTVAPRVTQVWFDGSNSVHVPYRVPTGSGEQLRTVPMGGVDTIMIGFDEYVDLNGSELTAYGVTTGTTYALNFIGGSAGMATWQLANSAVFPAEQLLLTLSDSVVDAAGNALDGEFTNPWTLADASGSSTTLPSGDGAAGGDFRFRTTMLSGDFNRDNIVDSVDSNIWAANYNLSPATHAHGDTDGNGTIDANDYHMHWAQYATNFTNWKSIEPGMILVSSVADQGDDGVYSIGYVTLREALARANAQAGHDTIVFRDSLSGQPINLSLGQLVINSDVTIAGPGADELTIDANLASRVFYVAGSGTLNVAMSGLTITGGSVVGDGAGIYNEFENLTLSEVEVVGNHASGATGLGGGVFTVNGSLTVVDSTFRDNTATRGGAIRTQASTWSTLNVTGSAFYNNSASGAEGALSTHFTTATIANSTFSGNSAPSGGAIRTNGSGQMTITNSTIVLNTATYAGAGIQVTGTGTVTLHNTILAQNTLNGTTNNDVSGPLAAASSYNILGAGANGQSFTGVGNQIGSPAAPIDPKLGALADNGGPTKTHALLQNSPAIDAGNNDAADDLPLDQRDRTRFWDGDGDGFVSVDIGAYEVAADEFFNSWGA